MIITREDLFHGVHIHTLASMRFDTPCWHAPEIEAALDVDLVHLGVGWVADVDFARLDGEDAFDLYEALGMTTPAERPLPAVVLFPTGLTLACMDRPHGGALRRILLSAASNALRENFSETRLERELRILYRDDEMQDRTRKARTLHRAVEAARRSGHLFADDAGYAECMASIAEIATGLRFPIRPDDNESNVRKSLRQQRSSMHPGAERASGAGSLIANSPEI
jgi:hypothetical protein